MKRLIFPCLLIAAGLLFNLPASAQQGRVTYEEVVKMDLELPPEMEHMRDQIPDSRTATRQLLFDETASLLKDMPAETEPEDIQQSSHGGMVRIQFQREENETYLNFEENEQIRLRSFMGRTFLITGPPAEIPWRLTEERSEFLGYMCQKAVAQMDSTSYEAWFTPEISVPTGPGEGGLPGLILVLSIDDGQRSYTAKEVTMEAVAANEIVPPQKGKKVTQEEFDEIVAEKMKEMDMTSNGRNGVFIRMRH